MKTLTKFLSLFLTLCMVLGAAPAAALASEAEAPEEPAEVPACFEEIEEEPVNAEEQWADTAPAADEELPAELPEDVTVTTDAFEEPEASIESPAPETPAEITSHSFTKQPESGIVPAGEYYTISWSTNFTALRVWLFALEPGLDKPGENAEPLQKLSDEEIACGEAEISPSDKEQILAVWYAEGEDDYILSKPFAVTMAPVQEDESVNESDDGESVGDTSVDDPLQEDAEEPITLDKLSASKIPGFFPESVAIPTEDGIMMTFCFWDAPSCTMCSDEPAFRISWETSFVPTIVTITFDSIGTTVTLTENLSASMYYALPFEDTEVSNADFHVVAFLDDTGVGSGVVAIPWNSLAFTQEPVVGVNDNRTVFHIGWETNFVPTGVEIGYLTDGSFHSFAAYTEGLSKNMTFDLPFDDAIDEDLIVRAYYGAGRYVDSAAFDLPWNGLPSAITIIHSCAFGNNLSIGYLIKVSDLDSYNSFWIDVSGTELRNFNTVTIEDTPYYRFVYSGIRAKQMGDELTAVLYTEKDGETLQSAPDVYSVKTYAYNMLGQPEDSTFKRLLVDMLNYGAAAQVYFNYKTDNLVNDDLTDPQKALGTPGTPPLTPANETFPLDGAMASFYGKSVGFHNGIDMRFYMQFAAEQATENVKLVLSYTAADGTAVRKVIPYSEFGDYNATTKHGTISSISAKDMGAVVTAVIYDGDTPISDTIMYSIETYAYNQLQKSSDETLKTLVTEMMKYGKSAGAYFSLQH